MKKLLSLLLLPIAFGVAAAVPFFQDGKTEWKIYLPEKTGTVETYSAEELKNTLKKISGAEFEIVRGKTPPPTGAIVLGSPETSSSIQKHAAQLKLNSNAETEQIAIRTIGGNLYLTGNNPRAGLYAVYYFLQKQLGVRWLWPGDDGEFIPQKNSWSLPDLAVNESPAFRFRELTPCEWHYHVPTEIWFARNFMNGGSRTRSINEKGGFIRLEGGHLIAVDKKEFAKHPEYFSLLDGKRVPEGEAGCWSNPKFTAEMVKRIVKEAKTKNLELINAFPADIVPRCQCAECTKNPDRSARWFNYYSHLIREVRKELPELKFAGIAYQEYRPVPSSPVQNLEYVEYCQYNRCYVHALENPNCQLNRDSLAELKRWKEKAPMGVYGYEFDIFKPWMYVPFWNMLADEMKLYHKMGLVRVKSEMFINHSKNIARENLMSLLLRLPYYMYTRLTWNPAEKTDDILRDWCKTVYGPAAEEFFQYHRKMAEAWDGMKIHVSYFHTSPTGTARVFLNPERIAFAEKQFALAEKKIAALPDSKEKKRILKETDLEKAHFRQWKELYQISTEKAVVVSLPKTDSFSKALPLKMTDRSGKSLPTEAKMYWDAEALHLLVTCKEPNMAKLRSGSPGRDVALWNNDNLELFIEPSDGSAYRHFALNPAGGTYDALGNNTAWNPEWQTKIQRNSDSWTVEFTLPFRALGATPRTGDQWRFVLNRNSRPEACGFPAPVYHDLASGAVLYFSETAQPERTLVWIDTTNKGLAWYAGSLLKKGWNFRYFNAADAMKADFSSVRMIVISLTWLERGRIPNAFWKEKLVPAVKNGAVVLFNAYGIPELDRYFSDPSFKVGFNDFQLDSLRKTTFIASNSFADTPDNMKKVLGHTPPGVFPPAVPEKWVVLARQKMKDGHEEPYLLARPFGKGMVVVSGLINYAKGSDAVVSLLNNLLEYNKTIPR